jgi:signal transduction histidine kinase
MPGEPADPHRRNQTAVSQQFDFDLPLIFTRISLKAGLAVFLLAGLFLFSLGRYNYLLVHTLIEIFSIILLTAVFLIGWNTRQLVHGQFFVILAIGFLLTGMVDLLHTFSYKGMQLTPWAGADAATQLWLIARSIGASAFLCAALTLGRGEICSAKTWLLSFLIGAGMLTALVWPLGLFPVCYIEGVGLTPFKVYAEYTIIGLFLLAAMVLLVRAKHLNRQLVSLLLTSIGMSIASELMFTLYTDVYGFFNFLGHYFKLGSVVVAYLVLVEGTLRSPYATLFRGISQSYEELNDELNRRVAAEKQQEQASRETSILYRMSRMMHSTLNLDELAHLVLSAATSVEAGGFERATLFTVNRRTGMLQGMLGVQQDLASLVLPAAGQNQQSEHPQLGEDICERQRLTLYNQKVVKQRLPLNADDNALARALMEQQVVLVPEPDNEAGGGRHLSRELELGPYACAPLVGRDQVMGVLLVDNHVTQGEIPAQRSRFLQLFAAQAGSALENASLVKRLEMAHDNLHDVQEQLIHGETMAVLGEMAAQVAHELRNPLVSIGGFAQRLSRQDLKDPQANEYAGIIAREVRRMEEMLDNILSFSNTQAVCLDQCNIVDALQEVIDLENENCQKQDIAIISDVPTSLPEVVGDYRQLRQVFHNLLVNARQVIGEKGVIKIRAKAGAIRGEQAVVVEVEDTGGGIRPEVMRNIFNPFFSTFAKGTGLGLSISHRILAHHHGDIEVVNAEQGARFIVTLPVIQPGSFVAGRAEDLPTG